MNNSEIKDSIFNMPVSVEELPDLNASAIFTAPSSGTVFREDNDIVPKKLSDTLSIMPWGTDNDMPFSVLDLIERDETLSTCLIFNAEACYCAGIHFDTCRASNDVIKGINVFSLVNDLPFYFLGVCQDIKHFGFAVSLIILNEERTRIVSLSRKEACYCRFQVADKSGHIPSVVYANWRKPVSDKKDYEVIPLLNPADTWNDLNRRIRDPKNKEHKFAIVTRIPTPDHTYYPIPHYASLFRGKWYDIKQIIGIAKESKLRNSAPIKYQIEVSNKYWDSIFQSEKITDLRQRQERVIKEKKKMLEFLTGAENSGKVWFSQYYVTPDGREQHDIVIKRIETGKEGGDWETDIQEAINMICFAMRVHSNLVGSVPGKAQSNNSGSDKRELFTIAQAMQKPYHDLLSRVFNMIIAFNNWSGVEVSIPFVQLTTLDEHKDSKTVSVL